MSVESDKLKEMVDNADSDAADIQSSIDGVSDQIAEEQAKQDALEFAMDSCINDTTSGLTYALLPLKDDYVRTYGNYGVSNAEDWVVCDIKLDNDDPALDDITYVSDNEFTCVDDYSSVFPVGQVVVFDLGGTSVQAEVDDVEFDGTATTTVTLDDSVLTSGVIIAAIPTYIYGGIGWDGDPDIQARIDEFAFAYDYKIQPLGSGGTYGTQDKIAKLGDAKSLLTNTKNKIADSKTKLAQFAS